MHKATQSCVQGASRRKQKQEAQPAGSVTAAAQARAEVPTIQAIDVLEDHVHEAGEAGAPLGGQAA